MENFWSRGVGQKTVHSKLNKKVVSTKIIIFFKFFCGKFFIDIFKEFLKLLPANSSASTKYVCAVHRCYSNFNTKGCNSHNAIFNFRESISRLSTYKFIALIQYFFNERFSSAAIFATLAILKAKMDNHL